MISGDLNIIDVQMVGAVQHQGSEPLPVPGGRPRRGRRRPAQHPGRPARRADAERRHRSRPAPGWSASVPWAQVLAEDRLNLQDFTRSKLQEILDSYGTGINIISVELQKVEAPEDVPRRL